MTPTILIVDDSPSIHQLVSSYFDHEPWHICSAYSGVEGLEMAASRGAEVVLLDVDLPDMNGFHVCREMRQVASRAAVIFLTSSSSIDEKVCGLHLGGVDYITKPFDPAELAERVRNSLRTKRLLDKLPESASTGRSPTTARKREGVDKRRNGRTDSLAQPRSHNTFPPQMDTVRRATA
jgi:DNA-binding response OmpR family regulator